MQVDVAIIGGGPAGSVTAALLRRQCPELSVAVIEAAAFPRHHVGEACLPGWHEILVRAGVFETLNAELPIQKLGFLFHWGEGDDVWTADFREADGTLAPASWHVDRSQLDRLLLEHAARLGARVMQPARVVGVRPLEGPTPPPVGAGSPGFHLVIDGGEDLEARWVVDASGQARLLARLWELPLQGYADMNNVALYGYWKGGRVADNGGPQRETERWAVVGSADAGWVWHIPIGPDCVSVGLVTHRDTVKGADLQALYHGAVAGCAAVAPLLEGAAYLGRLPDGTREGVAAVRDWSYSCARVCGRGWFVVGDGAAFVDPVLASGMMLATHGASMVANAITTLQASDVDAELLQRSYLDAYRDMASAYHRVARVWYARNDQAGSWHWSARRERLRTAGSSVVGETDADAFTALTLGVIQSPLDQAVSNRTGDGWGGDFFTWLTSERFFGGASGPLDDATQARLRSRSALARRWTRLARSTAALRAASWAPREGYHTNKLLDRWERVRFVQLDLDDDLDDALRLVTPTFPEAPEGIYPYLDGGRPLGEAVAALVAPHTLGSQDRRVRLEAAVMTLIQLDMLDLLETHELLGEPSLQGSVVLQLVGLVLRAVGGPCTVRVAVGWLGDTVRLRVDDAGIELYRGDFRGDAMLRSTGSALRWRRGAGDEVAAGLAKRLARVDGPAWWDAMARFPSEELLVRYVPGSPLVAERPWATPGSSG